MAVDRAALERIGRDLLVAIGEDPDRDGLFDTPARFARWWAEFVDRDHGTIDRTFTVDNVDEIVAVTGIRVWSLCEHHLLPFSADVSIGYIPTGKVLGLSKFARIAHRAASRPQVQERLVHDVADAITEVTGTPDVAVVAAGEHLCMTMRGVRTPASMRTSVMRGRFRANPDTRAEFLDLVR